MHMGSYYSRYPVSLEDQNKLEDHMKDKYTVEHQTKDKCSSEHHTKEDQIKDQYIKEQHRQIKELKNIIELLKYEKKLNQNKIIQEVIQSK